ncbi:MAG: hypothetical protein ABR503_09005, partial [Chitinophagaceae bacterium]
FLLFSFFSVFGQGRGDPRKDIHMLAGSLFYEVDGKPLMASDFSKVIEGSYFFNEGWMNSLLILNNGNQYKNINARLDLFNGNVHYQDQYGAEFIATSNIKEIILTDTVADINYRFIHASALTLENNSKKPQWYQWLHSGKASLYKLFDKQSSEQKRYGSSSTEISIKTAEKYFIHYNGIFIEVKKLKEIPSLLSIKKTELEAFLQSEKLKAISSKEDRFLALIQHFNFLMR